VQVRVNSEKLRSNLEETAARLARDPGAGHVWPSVHTELVADVFGRSDFDQYGRRFGFESDEAVERGGGGSAPSPLRYLLSSLAFCQQGWFAKAAALTGLEIEDLEIDVHTYMDMRGEHLVGDVPAHPQWIVVETHVAGAGDPDRVLATSDEASARCPVRALLARAVPIHERIHHRGALIRDTVPADLGPMP
jgi:uncharacterized OsmC-like protein